ncbi:hypothetical protein OPIT5_26130 [Opitutaceae bacterium TAV5]|nr:hypothetical protein OPIT5_26130 [Opitutaceae bacterium TAV5]
MIEKTHRALALGNILPGVIVALHPLVIPFPVVVGDLRVVLRFGSLRHFFAINGFVCGFWIVAIH